MACVFTFFLGSCDRLRRTWTFRWFASWSSLFSAFPSLDQRQCTRNLRQLKAVTGRVGEGHRRFRTSSSLKDDFNIQSSSFRVPFWVSGTFGHLKHSECWNAFNSWGYCGAGQVVRAVLDSSRLCPNNSSCHFPCIHHFWIEPGLLDSSLKSKASSPWNPCVPEKCERARPTKALSSQCRRSSFKTDATLGSHVGEISCLLAIALQNVPVYHWRILQDGVGCIAMAVKPTANLLEELHDSPATQSTQSTKKRFCPEPSCYSRSCTWGTMHV